MRAADEMVDGERYGFAKKSYHGSLYRLSNLEENMHLLAYSIVIFCVPFLLGHPQILVGTIVNASLILGATYLKGHKMLPLILLPSIAVLMRGMVFGPFTIFLLYMVPFIWLGNSVYAYTFKYLRLRKTNSIVSIAISSSAKAALLFGGAFILVKLQAVPVMLLTAMGLVQLTTAATGGALALGIIAAREKIKNSSNHAGA